MAEILRPNFDKLWASAGSVIEPSELKIEMGWMEEVPPSQWENWIQLRQDQAIKYIFQRGIPAWDAKEEYFAGRSAVLLDGDIYIALRNNVNKSPKTNAADWRVVTKDLTIANISGLQAALNNKADKTVSITGVGGLTGGGTLAANRTIDLSAATKNSLILADGALQKTQNLNDLPNVSAARHNLGLGTAATRNVGEASGDVMEVGAFGLGGKGVANNNLEGKSYLAYYAPHTLPTNYPDGVWKYGAMLSIAHNFAGTNMDMVFTHTTNSKILYRYSRNAPWREIYHSGNFNPDNKANTTTQIVAGDGLTGGGSLAANRTLTLGTPSTITKTATNSVSSTSHTHELGADVKAALQKANTAVQPDQIKDSLCPTGVVMAFAMSEAPHGWLKCNGQEVSRSEYQNLFAAIGTRYGSGNGSTTFNLPDLRGEFVRGWDDSRGVDPSRELGSAQDAQNLEHTHTASTNSAGAHTHTGTAASAGSHSHTGTANSAGAHTHTFPPYLTGPVGFSGPKIATNNSSGSGNIETGSAGNHTHSLSIDSSGAHTHSVSVGSAGGHSHTVTINSSGGSDLRPRNIALLYCIKY